MTSAVDYYSTLISGNPIPKCLSEQLEQIKALGNIAAKLRSEVTRDRQRNVTHFPQAEIGTRLTKQLLKLGQGLAIFNEQAGIGDQEVGCLIRVARDSVPRQRIELMRALNTLENYEGTTFIGEKSNTPTSTAKESLEELWMLGLLDRQGTGSFEWRLADKTRQLLAVSGILTDTNKQNHLCMHDKRMAKERTQGGFCLSEAKESGGNGKVTVDDIIAYWAQLGRPAVRLTPDYATLILDVVLTQNPDPKNIEAARAWYERSMRGEQ